MNNFDDVITGYYKVSVKLLNTFIVSMDGKL
jgi:hypothetical protein